jgi:hypothetical protein
VKGPANYASSLSKQEITKTQGKNQKILEKNPKRSSFVQDELEVASADTVGSAVPGVVPAVLSVTALKSGIYFLTRTIPENQRQRSIRKEHAMRRFLGPTVVLVAILSISGCEQAGNPQELIVGRWNVKQQFGMQEISGKTEFRKNGSMTTEAMGMRMNSTYKFLDRDNIEVRMAHMTEKNYIESIRKDRMVLVDPKGGRAVFTRIN